MTTSWKVNLVDMEHHSAWDYTFSPNVDWQIHQIFEQANVFTLILSIVLYMDSDFPNIFFKKYQ